MEIAYLCDHPTFAPALAHAHVNAFGALLPDWTAEQALDELKTHDRRRAIPQDPPRDRVQPRDVHAVVALEGGPRLVGDIRRARRVPEVVLQEPQQRGVDLSRSGAFLACSITDFTPGEVIEVRLTGVGPSFCSGGDLDEFGSATDPGAAHTVRMEASAGLAVHRLRDRVRPVLHGACVGAGIEVPAFAEHLTARDRALAFTGGVLGGFVLGLTSVGSGTSSGSGARCAPGSGRRPFPSPRTAVRARRRG